MLLQGKGRLQRKFQNVIVPHIETLQRTVNELRERQVRYWAKTESKHRVLTEDKLDDTGDRLETLPLENPQTPCTTDRGFKIVGMNCHKIENKINYENCSALIATT